MRLSIACAATNAEFQNRIILHDNTYNLPVVVQQSHPDPNYALKDFVMKCDTLWLRNHELQDLHNSPSHFDSRTLFVVLNEAFAHMYSTTHPKWDTPSYVS
jgi:hypothetical protein